MISIDTGCDLHTHSNLTDGTAPPHEMAAAAVAAGLHTWGLSDHVRADSDWVADYAKLVRGLRVDGLDIRCGVEAKIVNTTGALDLPQDLPDLDYILIADHQFPARTGPLHPRAVAEQIVSGRMRQQDVVDQLIEATCAAVHRAPSRAVVVHPFSLLPKMGMSEDQLGEHHLDALATACRDAGAAVEINEKWTCPTPSVAARLAALGLPLVAGSDAHRCTDVGVWTYLHEVTRELPDAPLRPRPPDAAAPLVAATS